METTSQLILMEPDRAKALIWTRDGADRRLEEDEGIDAVLSLISIETDLPLAEAYEGVTLAD